MAELTAARGVAPSDLGSYQHAVRLVLTNDLITASRPRAGALATVLRWADLMARDFAALFGYTLIATAHQVRLVRRLDTVDDTQRSVFAARSGRPFDRRRLAYLCLVLAVFQRSRIEISLADLVRAFAPTANAIDGLGFDATITEHKRAVVDVLDWLADHGALRLSDGSAENWARDTDRGDALYDIDHDICAALFRPARPIQHLPGAAGLLEADDISAKRSTQREAAARRARRLLLEHPVALLRDPRRGDGRRAAQHRPGRQPGPAHRPGRGAAGRGRAAGRPHRLVHRPAVPRPGRGGQPHRWAAAGQGRRPAGGPRRRPGADPAAGADRRGRPAGPARPDRRGPPGRPGEDQDARSPGGRRRRASRCRRRSSSGPGWRACSTTCTTDFGAASFTAQWQHDRQGCWPRRCGSWMTCGSSGACPAAR